MTKIGKIYFIDDSDDEAFLSKVIFRTKKIDIDIVHYADFSQFFADLGSMEADELKGAIAVLDFNLTVMNGADGLKRIRQAENSRTLIAGICSGSEDPADRKAAMDAGANFFAPKPLDRSCLEYICDVVPDLHLSVESSGNTVLTWSG